MTELLAAIAVLMGDDREAAWSELEQIRRIEQKMTEFQSNTTRADGMRESLFRKSVVRLAEPEGFSILDLIHAI
ncbi:MAG: hypothetical protein O3A00_11300 [Planctomycetota bacterium]|nr:hypothetical protein [Planctomycetota bacterium]